MPKTHLDINYYLSAYVYIYYSVNQQFIHIAFAMYFHHFILHALYFTILSSN